MKKRSVLLKLFFSTLYLSAFTFGGGYVIVTLMKKQFVDKYHWIEESEMLDLIAIAQSAPGAIAVNGSIVAGYKLAGLVGAVLAVIASYGTRFHNFVDELVRIEVEYTCRYMTQAGCAAHMGDAMTQKLLHIVTTSRFEGIFEVIRHGMSREEAAEYINLLSRYHRTGFFAVFGAQQA